MSGGPSSADFGTKLDYYIHMFVPHVLGIFYFSSLRLFSCLWVFMAQIACDIAQGIGRCLLARCVPSATYLTGKIAYSYKEIFLENHKALGVTLKPVVAIAF